LDYYEGLECGFGKWDNSTKAFCCHREGALLKEVSMLATRHRLPRNPLFQFHPLHTLFSVVGALILFGLLVWFLAVPAK